MGSDLQGDTRRKITRSKTEEPPHLATLRQWKHSSIEEIEEQKAITKKMESKLRKTRRGGAENEESKCLRGVI